MQGIGAAYGLLVSLLVGTAAGFGLDRAAGTAPWGLLGGCLLGFGAGMYSLYKSMFPPR
ncbi:MAG: AtpZ/AtpI family protein [Candidatus Sericytochromatia bacterium]|nr:AtpZ/AtpI family protein [Candidatus Sericytochromatia bacterium]